MNENWPRWCFASISKHFDDNRQGIPLFIEGQPRDTRALDAHIELRVDGPEVNELSRGFWRLYFEVNVLVEWKQNDANYHTQHQNVGIVAKIFTCIPVYKYGTNPQDDGSFVGYLKLLSDWRRGESVEAHNFGVIDVGTRVMQSTVEGHYEMHLRA